MERDRAGVSDRETRATSLTNSGRCYRWGLGAAALLFVQSVASADAFRGGEEILSTQTKGGLLCAFEQDGLMLCGNVSASTAFFLWVRPSIDTGKADAEHSANSFEAAALVDDDLGRIAHSLRYCEKSTPVNDFCDIGYSKFANTRHCA